MRKIDEKSLSIKALIVGETGLRHWITGLVLALFFCLFPRLGFCASPLVGRINPSSGASQPNQTVNFTASYSDPDGWQNIKGCYFLINTTVNGQNSFYGYYDQNSNKLYLRDNSNKKWLGGFAPGIAKAIENSYAKLYCGKTAVSGSGNSLTISWSVSFKSTFTGTKNLYLFVIDDTNSKTRWVKKGTWNIQTPLDSTPPTGSIKINNNHQYTNSATVTLNLSAQDNPGGSGLSQMQFSNEAVTWSAPEAYAPTKTWSLPLGDGQKSVFVKFKDKAGNWSQAYSSTINLDTTVPEIMVFVPQDGETLPENTDILITAAFNDPDPSPLEYQFSIDGVILQPWLPSTFNIMNYNWLTSPGKHSLKIEVRDVGGEQVRENEIYVFRQPPLPTQ